MKQIYFFIAFTFTTFSFSQVPSLEWDRIFQGNNHMSIGFFETDELGNSYVAGVFDDTTLFYTNQNGWNVYMNPNYNSIDYGSPFFAKFDSDGEVIYAGFDYPVGYILPLNNGDAFNAGGRCAYSGAFTYNLPFNSSTQIQLDSADCSIYFQRLDWNGSIIYEKILLQPGINFQNWGATNDVNENLYLTIKTDGVLDVDPDPMNATTVGAGVHLVKYDENGDFINTWPLPNVFESNNLFVDDFGNIYFSGIIHETDTIALDAINQTVLTSNQYYYNSINHSEHLVLAKYDQNMNYQWHYKFSGRDYWNPILLDVNQSEELVISYNFEDTSYIYQGNVIADTLIADDTLLYKDFYVMKVDATGQKIIDKSFGGMYCDVVSDIEFDINDNLYIFGAYCQDSINLDFYSNNSTLPYTNTDNCFIVKYDDNMNIDWGDHYSAASGYAYSVGVETDYNGHVYTAWRAISDSLEYNPSLTPFYEVLPVEHSSVILKYASPYLDLEDKVEASNEFVLFPNPNNGQFNLKFEEQVEEIQIDIFSIQGQLIYSENHFQTNLIHSSFEAPKGIYLMKVSVEGSEQTLKLIIE